VCPRTGSRYEVDADGLLIEIADAQKIA
jgi:hypothetical protein